MQLRHLLAALPEVVAVSGDALVNIANVVSDSRQVTPGALFVAYRGWGVDGHRFIADALDRGAAAIVGELSLEPLPVPYIQVPDGRAALAWLAAAWYDHPSAGMNVVGITGTDGKTTTANLLFNMLRAAGYHTSLISTVNAIIGGQVYETGLHTTTPDAPDVQRYLAQMVRAGTEVAVLEVTSHGLAQHRVTGCAFDVAVVTNITHEHLDFHGTYEAYRAAKAMLFRSLAGSPSKPGRLSVPKTAVLNRDDSSYPYLAAIPAPHTITYGWESAEDTIDRSGTRANQNLTLRNVRPEAAGTGFELEISGRDMAAGETMSLSFVTPLIGSYNLSNILAGAGAALALGVPAAAIQEGVRRTASVPGRMERITCGQDFTAIVDFAHTPNALARALETARTQTGEGGRVICVFGCAGLRDRQKRHLMGEVAARLAGYTVITAEDPRTEQLEAIMQETADTCVTAGLHEGRDFVRVPDRQQALLHAVEQARPGDVVIACGKGHEQSMCFGTTEFNWRDQEAMCWAIRRARGEEVPPPFILPTWEPGAVS